VSFVSALSPVMSFVALVASVGSRSMLASDASKFCMFEDFSLSVDCGNGFRILGDHLLELAVCS